MSQIVDDLRQVAIEIKTETQVGGNTAARVGGAFERVADALDGTQQIADLDAAVAAVQAQAQASEQTIQDIVNNLAVTQTTGQSTSSVMSQKAVTDEIESVRNDLDIINFDALVKFNADDINQDYESGLINHQTGAINTSYPAWRTSKFLRLPTEATTIEVHGVFPLKTSLNAVGCFLYDENFAKVGYPSNIPTATAAASFSFSMSNYPTARYIRISEFQSGGWSGDNTFAYPILVSKNGVLENEDNINELDDDLSINIPFCIQKEYITTSGEVKNTGGTTAYATDYIKVKSGDILHFNNIGWNSSTLNHCWGYDEYKNAVVCLVSGYTLTAPFNGDIVVPNNVSFIKAFGSSDINPSLKINQAQAIEESTEKVDFDIVGSFIDNTGEFKYNSSPMPLRTRLVAVNEGDIYIAKDLFWGGESTLSNCWGYDSNGVPVQELVPCYPASNPFNGKIVIPNGVSYISAFSRNSGHPMLYKKGSIYDNINFVAALGQKNVGIKYVSVVQDGTNYNLIRTLLSSITDASADNQYVVIIPNGNYFECDLKGKKYVTLHGESKEHTIIYCDGTSSNVTPSDYTFAEDANKPLSSVSKDHKHIFHLSADLTIENCTLQSNDVKYCIHFEDSAWAKAIIKDCIFIATNNHSAVGFGMRWKQQAEFARCEFRVTGCAYAVYVHNWDWEKTTEQKIPISGGGVLVKFSGCKFSNLGQIFLTIGEIGSFNDDKVVFVCCKTDNPVVRALVETNGNRTYHKKKDGTYETNPLLVPYCMHLDMINCGVENTIVYDKINRPDFENNCMIIN